jgi:hypothetical protein
LFLKHLEDLGSICLEIANRPDLLRITHGSSEYLEDLI